MSNAEEMELNMEWVETLQKRLVVETEWDYPGTIKPKTFRVPKRLRDNNPNAYDPVYISLGPYHRDKGHLQAMYNLKWHCLQKFLELDPYKALVDYLKLMKKLEPQARNAYSEDPMDMDSNDFALMLLLDGCFVVWTIISRSLRDGGLEDLQNPIDSKPWPLPVVAQDMLILENQLPFFLLEHLYDFANFRGHSSTNSTSIAVLAFEFFRIFLNLKMKMPSNIEGQQFHHLLHLVHSCISPPENQDGGESSTGSRWGEEYGGASFLWIPTATQLMHSGVYPCRKMYAANILDITFDYENIRIPPVEVDHTSNKIFGNLIAFEQCYEDMNPHFTAYAIAMDCMVHTASDATLLEDCGIITNSWGDSKEVPKFFNNLCKGVMIDMNRCYLLNVFTHIKKHRSKIYNTWMARLNRDYFSSPWAAISFIEAVVLLLIGIIQTIYTVLQYLKSK